MGEPPVYDSAVISGLEGDGICHFLSPFFFLLSFLPCGLMTFVLMPFLGGDYGQHMILINDCRGNASFSYTDGPSDEDWDRYLLRWSWDIEVVLQGEHQRSGIHHARMIMVKNISICIYGTGLLVKAKSCSGSVAASQRPQRLRIHDEVKYHCGEQR